MARLLGEARVSVLPDGTRFKPEAEAAVKKATAGINGKIKLDLDTKGMQAQAAAAGAEIIAMQNRVAKARQADSAAEARDIASRAKMYAGMFDQISKGEAAQKAQEAAIAKAQQSSLDRIGKARQADILSQQKGIQATQNMYSKLFNDLDKRDKIKVGIDGQYTDAQFAKFRAKIDAATRKTDIRLGLNSKLAEGEALSLREKLKLILSGITATVRVKTDRSFGGVINYIRGRFTRDVEDAAGGAGNSGGSSFLSKFGNSFTKSHAIAAAVVAGLAALPAAVGAVGVLAGIALGAGLVFGAEKLINSQVKTVTAQVKALTSAIGKPATSTTIASQQLAIQSTQATISRLQGGGTPATGPSSSQQAQQQISIANKQLAIQNTQATISRLEAVKKLTAPQQQQLSIARQRLVIEKQSLALAQAPLSGTSAKGITASQQQQLAIARQRLVIEKQTLAASQSKGQGTAAQQAQLKAAQQQLAVLQQEKAAFIPLDNAMKGLRTSFINFAIIASKPLIKPFTDAIRYLSGQLNGPLTTAFTKLFTAVGPLVKPVVAALLEIVQGVLPGLTEMLTRARKPLSDMFIGFGRIVGLSVGQWFREAIPYIKDSGTYFLDLVKILGAAGTFLVKFGGEFAKAFAGSQFKGFGKSLQGIADSILKLLVPAFEGWTAVMAPLARILIDIIAPVLRLLAANPTLTKTIFALIAAWMIYSKTLAIVRAAILFLGITTDIALGPWVALALVVAAAAYLIVTHWGTISSFFVKIWKHIWSGFIGPLINFFTNTIPHAFGVTLNWLKKNWPLLVSIIGGPIGAVVVLVIKYHKQIFNAIKDAWGHIENTVTGIIKPIASVVEGVWNQIYRVTRDVLKVIVTIVKIQVLIVVGIIGEAWRGIKNLTGIVWPWIYKTIKDAWGHIENATTGIVKPMVSVVVGAWNSLKNATKATYDWLFNTIKGAWGHIENATTGIVKPMVSVVVGAWNNLKQNTKAAYDWLFNTIKGAWGHIENATTGIVKPMVSVVNGLWKNLESWTSTAFKTVYNYIINPLEKAATWVGNTFVKSIEGAFHGLISTVTAIWNGLRKSVAVPINFVINDIWNPFAKFVNSGLSIFGISTRLPPGTPVKFAGGGKVPGFAPGVDSVPAMLSPGEFVLRPQAVAAIGTENLHKLNKMSRRFANGGDVVNDIEKWNGHKYIWGGGANPTTGWDCSSFVNWIVGHDFKLNLPGGGSWARETNNGAAHGPVAASYNNWNYGRGVPWSGAKKGDLAIENNGAHIGFIIQDNTSKRGNETLMGFAARSPSSGTGYEQFFPSAFHLERFADDRGFGSQVFDNTIGAVLRPLAGLALNGIEGLVNGALNHIPGGGVVPKLAKSAIDKVITAAKNKLTGNQGNYQFDNLAVTGQAPIAFSKIAGVTQWENDVSKVLSMLRLPQSDMPTVMSQIQTESGGNPNAINLTDINAQRGDPSKGLLQVISGTFAKYRNPSLSSNIYDPMANIYAGINYAIHRYGNPGWLNVLGHGHGYAMGGLVGKVFDSGGTLAPGANLIYNLTGKPEHVTPTGGSGQNTVTLEITGGDSDVEQFLVQLIRKYARVKGGGNVQTAFGKNR